MRKGRWRPLQFATVWEKQFAAIRPDDKLPKQHGPASAMAEPHREVEPAPRCRVYSVRMKIGELAKAAGIKISTIRFYERRKLLRPAARTASGYRTYTELDLQAVKGIRLTQELGFTLREIRELLELHRVARTIPLPVVDGKGVQHAILMTEEKLRGLDHKARVIRRMRRDVLKILKTLRSASGTACPFASREQSLRASSKKKCPQELNKS